MDKQMFVDRYKRFKLNEEEINDCLETICAYERQVSKDIKETTIEDIKSYMAFLVESNTNTYNNVIHFARYYYYIGKKEEYVFMTRYFNTLGVLENIIDRITLSESETTKSMVMKDVVLPPFGTDAELLPSYTKDFMDKLDRHLSKDACQKILAGNNHGIPKASFDQEKAYYQEAESLEVYLKERHERKVQELTNHYQENKVWFEQIITQDVIDYVKNNQEILSGVIKGNKLYVTKIPYDTSKFLNTTDSVAKRYYACHCTFVRENIKNEILDMPKEWCNCSAGFAKYPFEVILNQPLNVSLLKTPLDGDEICRFEIDLEGVFFK